MARRRTTIQRIDPWSILKFGFVANIVLLGIELLAGLVVWYVIQRLELIQTVCELAASVGFEECGVDGGALFDTVLVLGLLAVVIQTGILVFLTFLANLIFDLTGGIVVTLEDDRAPGSGSRESAGVGSRASGSASFSGAGAGSVAASRRSGGDGSSPDGGGGPPVPPLGAQGAGGGTTSSRTGVGTPDQDATAHGSDGDRSRDEDGGAATGAGRSSDDDTLFGGS